MHLKLMVFFFIAMHFGLSFLAVVILGFLQLRSHNNEQQGECYGLSAILIIVSQAVLTILVYQGSVLFPFAALFLAFTLLCHHTIIHWNSDFRGESCSCAPFQCKDIRNHETWVVAALVAAFVSGAQL